MEDKTITLEEHEIMGMIGKILNDKLVSKEVEISNNAKNKVEGRKLSNDYKQANKSLSEFRNHMVKIMFKEFPEQRETAGFDSIYYGSRNKERDIILWTKKYLEVIEEKEK